MIILVCSEGPLTTEGNISRGMSTRSLFMNDQVTDVLLYFLEKSRWAFNGAESERRDIRKVERNLI